MSSVDLCLGEPDGIVARRRRPSAARAATTTTTTTVRRSHRAGGPWWRWVAAWAVFFPGGGLAYHLATQADEGPALTGPGAPGRSRGLPPSG